MGKSEVSHFYFTHSVLTELNVQCVTDRGQCTILPLHQITTIDLPIFPNVITCS